MPFPLSLSLSPQRPISRLGMFALSHDLTPTFDFPVGAVPALTRSRPNLRFPGWGRSRSQASSSSSSCKRNTGNVVMLAPGRAYPLVLPEPLDPHGVANVHALWRSSLDPNPHCWIPPRSPPRVRGRKTPGAGSAAPLDTSISQGHCGQRCLRGSHGSRRGTHGRRRGASWGRLVPTAAESSSSSYSSTSSSSYSSSSRRTRSRSRSRSSSSSSST